MVYTPAFNWDTKLGNQEIRKALLDTLPAIGQHAFEHGTRILMEPLNRKEEFFLRQVADAASIARDCNNPGVCVMGDFYHMFMEETSDLGAFISGGPYLHHVHLASRTRNLPGQDERQFVEGFRGLKWIGYQDYCSFECSVRGEPKVEIPKSMAFLREQWSKAKAIVGWHALEGRGQAVAVNRDACHALRGRATQGSPGAFHAPRYGAAK